MNNFKDIKGLLTGRPACARAAAGHRVVAAGRSTARFITSLALLSAVCACGEGQRDSETDVQASPGALSAATAGPDDIRHSWALLDDLGQPMPTDPNAMPTDPSQRQQGLRYATAAAAQALEEALGSRALHLQLFDAGQATQASALSLVHKAEEALQAPAGLYVLVSSPHLQHANDLALRLGELGFERVWVVTP